MSQVSAPRVFHSHSLWCSVSDGHPRQWHCHVLSAPLLTIHAENSPSPTVSILIFVLGVLSVHILFLLLLCFLVIGQWRICLNLQSRKID